MIISINRGKALKVNLLVTIKKKKKGRELP